MCIDTTEVTGGWLIKGTRDVTDQRSVHVFALLGSSSKLLRRIDYALRFKNKRPYNETFK